MKVYQMYMGEFLFCLNLNQVYVKMKVSWRIGEDFIFSYNLNQVYVEMKVYQMYVEEFLFY